jgi:hypothetical protein
MATEMSTQAGDEAMEIRGAEWKLALFTAAGCAVLSVLGMVLNATRPGSTQLDAMVAIAAFYGALAAGEFVQEAGGAWMGRAKSARDDDEVTIVGRTSEGVAPTGRSIDKPVRLESLTY